VCVAERLTVLRARAGAGASAYVNAADIVDQYAVADVERMHWSMGKGARDA
jgi:hypothetical protein